MLDDRDGIGIRIMTIRTMTERSQLYCVASTEITHREILDEIPLRGDTRIMYD